VALVLVLAGGDMARAQGVLRVSPLFGIAQVYDTNLFSRSTPSDRQADLITRVSPGLDSEYRTPLLTLIGRYTLDAERFADHSELTTMNARQQASIGFTYRVRPRLALAADAELATTQTPGELNMDTALTLARASARRIAASSSVTRQFSAMTAATLDYAFAEYTIAGAPATRSHAATIGTEHHPSLRDTVGVDYELRHFLFDASSTTAATGATAATSQALILGWNRAMTPRTTLAIAGGPRITNGAPAADLAASVHYQLTPADDLSLAYNRTQTTVIGLSGTTDTQSFTATASWSPVASLQVRVAPGFFRNVQARQPVDVFHLAVGVVRPIARRVSLDVGFGAYMQHGGFHAPPADARISRHDVIVRLVTTPPSRPR
jgi:hypothetical protein